MTNAPSVAAAASGACRWDAGGRSGVDACVCGCVLAKEHLQDKCVQRSAHLAMFPGPFLLERC
eukprot:268089-Chlamydomonas_euryale.AAC.1